MTFGALAAGTLNVVPAGWFFSVRVQATDTDFKPLDGTPAQATVVNASYFRWDGSNLGFTLVMDNATPPPPPANDE